jgi:hypothetical protein
VVRTRDCDVVTNSQGCTVEANAAALCAQQQQLVSSCCWRGEYAAAVAYCTTSVRGGCYLLPWCCYAR